MLSDQETCEQLKARLQSVYRAKKFLPGILGEEELKHKIKDTYVNLMLIEVDKPEVKNKEKGAEGEKVYGSYEDIRAKKTEIELENIFDGKSHPDKSVKEVNKVLIYGRAGIGKTTLCNYISYKWAQPASLESKGFWQDKFEYIFWLPLRSLSGDWHTLYPKHIGNHALECFIGRYCLDRDDRFSVKDISKVIKEGKVLLILDGYDEVASFHNEKHTVVKDVIDSAIAIRNPKAKVIMTSRPNAVSQGIVGKFDAEIENIGLKKENVCEYIKKYGFKKGRAEGLLALTKQYGHIESMAQVPINLYLLCFSWDEGCFKDQASITATGLYEEVTSWLMKKYLSKSQAKKLPEIDFDGIEKVCEEEYRLLEGLAYCGTRKKTAILRKEECQASGVDWGKLNTLKTLGILSGKGVEEGTREYEFIHLTFQEYFAAKHIVRLLGSEDLEKVKEAVKFINENKYNRVYERVILFIAGLVTLELPKQSGKQAMRCFWNVMLNGNVDLEVIKQLSLLIRCLEEGKCSEGIPGIDKVLEVIKQHSLKHVDKLEQSLIVSTQVLRRSGILESLVDKLENSDNEDVRSNAAYALRQLKLDDAVLAKMVVEALCKALEDPDKDVRYVAANALGQLKLYDAVLAKMVVEALCKALEDHDEDVRSAAADALRELKQDDAALAKVVVEALCKALEDPDEGARHAAAYALGQLKLDNAVLAKVVVEALCKALEDPDEDVRSAAADALGQLNPGYWQLTKVVVEALLKVLADTDGLVRSTAASVLGKLKPGGEQLTVVVKDLSEALKDTDKDVRRAAAYALGKLKLDDEALAKVVVEALCKALEDPDEDVRRATASVLGRLKLDDAVLAKMVVDALLKALKDHDEGARKAAAYALGRLKPGDRQLTKVVVKALCKALEDPDGLLRSDAASALGQLKLDDEVLAKVVVKALCKALEDADKKVRHAAASALKIENEILQEEVVESLLTVFKAANKVASDSAIGVLNRLEVVSRKAQRQITEALIENPSLALSLVYKVGLNRALEKCAINGISLSFRSHSIKLLELSSLKILQESAIILSNSYLTFHYGDHKLVFEFDTSDKELPLKVWEHFKKKAEKKGLLTEMLDSLRTGRKWIRIEGIDPEIDKVISNKITKHMEDIMIIKNELELGMGISGQKEIEKDLIAACKGKGVLQKYKDDDSKVLLVAMELARNEPRYKDRINGIITDLCKREIGLGAIDDCGNTVAHYSVMHNRIDVLQAYIKGGYYNKGVCNKSDATILHTAVYYNMISGLDKVLGENNFNFDQPAKIGGLTFTPIELAVALGNIEGVKLLWDMSKSIKAKSKWCDKNILNIAIKFKQEITLQYLIYQQEHRFTWQEVQNAYVYAAKVENICAMMILQKAFNVCFSEGSIRKCSSITGNTALHEAVVEGKMKVIDWLIGQEHGLVDEHDLQNQTVKELAKKLLSESDVEKKGLYNRILNILNTEKNIQDAKRFEIQALGELPIKNIIMEGGGPRGAAYVGALKEFEKVQAKEKDRWGEVERVAGTSAGSITGALYAIGYDAKGLKEALGKINLMDLLDNPNMEKLIAIKKEHEKKVAEEKKEKKEKKKKGEKKEKSKANKEAVKELWDLEGEDEHKTVFKLLSLLGEAKGICPGIECEKKIEKLIYEKTNIHNFTLGDLADKVRKGEKGYKELYMITVDISCKDEKDAVVILSTEDENYSEITLAAAVRASMSIPGVFATKKLEYKDKKTGEKKTLECIDGGVLYNYAIDIFDKVKFRHTGIRGPGNKPIYNEYTMGFSLGKGVIEIQVKEERVECKKAEKTHKVVLNKIEKGVNKAGVSALKLMVEGLFKIATKEDLQEVKNSVKAVIGQIRDIAEAFISCESAMNKYWEESIVKRTIRISDCGYKLLDFDLGEEGTKQLMKAGRQAVREKFGIVEKVEGIERIERIEYKAPQVIEVKESKEERNENAVTKKSSSMKVEKVEVKKDRSSEIINTIPTGIDKKNKHGKDKYAHSSSLSTNAHESSPKVTGAKEVSKEHIVSEERHRKDKRDNKEDKKRSK